MVRKWAVFVILIAALCLVSGSLAWDSDGHEQIADIAWTKLNAHAKTEIASILKAGDSRFRPKNDSEQEVRRAFRLAATFPDFIKSHRDTQYESLIGPMNRKWQPHPDPKDKEALFCKTWHYYDTPIRFNGTEPGVRASNALKAIKYARQQLVKLEKAGVKDRTMQCWWLYWIEHLTGDLHQPLHCASSYEFLDNTGDEGGNKFKTGLPDPRYPRSKMSLHAYWDTGIVRARQFDKANGLKSGVKDVTDRWTADPALAPLKADAGNLDAADWIEAGANLADSAAYNGIERLGVPSTEYRLSQSDTCRRQAVLAGYRLAAILNTALGK
jgi:hypothetical protein